jgi:hypothetical protein
MRSSGGPDAGNHLYVQTRRSKNKVSSLKNKVVRYFIARGVFWSFLILRCVHKFMVWRKLDCIVGHYGRNSKLPDKF